MPANVHCGSEVREYHFMHLVTIPDVLDEDRSKYVKGRLLSPCLDREKVVGHNVFVLRKLGLVTFVHKTVRNALKDSGLARFSFEKVEIN